MEMTPLHKSKPTPKTKKIKAVIAWALVNEGGRFNAPEDIFNDKELAVRSVKTWEEITGTKYRVIEIEIVPIKRKKHRCRYTSCCEHHPKSCNVCGKRKP